MVHYVVALTLFLAGLVFGKVEIPAERSMGRKSLDELYKTPEWLQDIPTESKVAKYRKRRAGSFLTGSTLNVETIATIPTVGLSDSGKFIVEADLTFNLPNGSYPIGRSFGPGQQRMDIYGRIEKFLGSMGYDGHSCTLRSICEVAELPFEHGLFGEVVNIILTATSGSFNDIEGEIEDEYTMAQYYGQNHGNCQEYYPACPVSIIEFLSMVVPTF